MEINEIVGSLIEFWSIKSPIVEALVQIFVTHPILSVIGIFGLGMVVDALIDGIIDAVKGKEGKTQKEEK